MSVDIPICVEVGSFTLGADDKEGGVHSEALGMIALILQMALDIELAEQSCKTFVRRGVIDGNPHEI